MIPILQFFFFWEFYKRRHMKNLSNISWKIHSKNFHPVSRISLNFAQNVSLSIFLCTLHEFHEKYENLPWTSSKFSKHFSSRIPNLSSNFSYISLKCFKFFYKLYSKIFVPVFSLKILLFKKFIWHFLQFSQLFPNFPQKIFFINVSKNLIKFNVEIFILRLGILLENF